MNVKVNESIMVRPAEVTPNETRLWISRLDMMIRQPFSHTHIFYIYPPNKSSSFFDVQNLKGALSRALVPYYPLAGRLKMNQTNNRFEIDCNETGVFFIDAETTCTLDDLTDESLRKELIPPWDYSKGLSSVPLLMVQFTRFRCGGVTLGMGSHHHAADGAAHTQFVNYWASMARGVDPGFRPSHDRIVYLGPRNPPRVNFRHIEYEPPVPPVVPQSFHGGTITTTECHLKLSEEQVNALQVRASVVGSDGVRSKKRSLFKVIAAHVWRTACKARGLADDQDVKLFIHTDGRPRLKEPSLPKGYFGNALFFSCCLAKAGDLIHNPLWYTLAKIDETIMKMDNSDYLRSAIDYLELQPDLNALVRGPHSVTSPNLFINSWTRLPLAEADFGWGTPTFTGQGGIKSEGQCTITPNPTEDKISNVGIRLYTSHVDLFKKYFYEFEAKELQEDKNVKWGEEGKERLSSKI